MTDVANIPTLLEARCLVTSYGLLSVLDNVSFEIGKGEVVALLGPNGAGKSTALRAVGGLLPWYNGKLETGTVRFAGEEVSARRTDELVKAGMGFVAEGRRVFRTLTVRENLELGGYVVNSRALIDRTFESVLDLFPQLKKKLKQLAGTLSAGEQQMLALGRALMTNPKLILADEPSTGLAPTMVEAVFDKIEQIAKVGVSILLAEQNIVAGLDVADRAYVFEMGRITLNGPAATVKSHPILREAYLGS
jgi:branched-chain amino acid transport system ATP-binding protein